MRIMKSYLWNSLQQGKWTLSSNMLGISQRDTVCAAISSPPCLTDTRHYLKEHLSWESALFTIRQRSYMMRTISVCILRSQRTWTRLWITIHALPVLILPVLTVPGLSPSTMVLMILMWENNQLKLLSPIPLKLLTIWTTTGKLQESVKMLPSVTWTL